MDLYRLGYSNTVDFLLLKRALGTAMDCVAQSCDSTAERNGAFGAAFRDIGAEIFDAVKTGEWDRSYAAMLGNGNGMVAATTTRPKTTYWASERVYSGQGATREDWKVFAWYQGGRRLPSGAKFGRSRMELGRKYLSGKYRVSGEFVRANGAIYAGTKGATVTDTYAILLDDSACGWYLDFGYTVVSTVGLNVRWDQLARITFNYELRSGTDPNNEKADNILSKLSNRLGFQVTAIY